MSGEVWGWGWSLAQTLELSSCRLTSGRPSASGQQTWEGPLAIAMSTCDGNWVKSTLTGSHSADSFCRKTLDLVVSLWDLDRDDPVLLH